MAKTGKHLFTPDGVVSLDEKDVVPLTPNYAIMLGLLHKFAHTYQLSLVCKRCDSALIGQNNDAEINAKGVSVSCQCTEWRYVPKR